MRTIKILSLILVLSLLTITPVAAQLTTEISPGVVKGPKTMTRTDGSEANATWVKKNDQGTIETTTFIAATLLEREVDLTVSICINNITTAQISCKLGYLTTPNISIFQMDKLKTARLDPIRMEIYDENFVPTLVTVAANWVGTGEKQKGEYTFQNLATGYTETFASNSTWRKATATGRVNEQSLHNSKSGVLIKFKEMTKTFAR